MIPVSEQHKELAEALEALTRIEQLLRETRPTRTAADYYTMDDLAATFKVSRSTIFRQRKAQNWPYHLIGTEIRFSAEDVQAIQAMNRRTPAPETPKRAPRIPKRK